MRRPALPPWPICVAGIADRCFRNLFMLCWFCLFDSRRYKLATFFLCQFSELEFINSTLRTNAKIWLFEHINCSRDLSDSEAQRSNCLKPSLSKPNLNLTQCNYLYLWSQMKQMEYFFNILIISKQYLHIILTVDQKMWPLTIQYLVNYPYLWSQTKQYRAFVQ